MVNLDMVGRGPVDSGKTHTQINGLDTAKEFTALIDSLADKHNLVLERVPTPGNRYFAASDHYSFYEKKVPVLFFFTGTHPDYHRPSDTSDKINVVGMREIADLSEEIIARLATDKERPTYVQIAQRGGAQQGVRLGVELSSDGKEGLLVDNVLADTSAAKAGVKKGDRIKSAAGKPVTSQAALVTILRGLRGGDKLELGVERDGKQETIPVYFALSVPTLGLTLNVDGKEGLLIETVTEGPASKGGLKKGDHLLEIRGKGIKDLSAVGEMLRGLNGDSLEVAIEREGKKQVLKLETPYTPRLGLRPEYNDTSDGVLINSVTEGAPAEKGGLKKGDRILELGGKKVKDLEAYMGLLQGRKRGDTLEVVVSREGKNVTLKVVLE
jgi:S1-C subfamily serine protease